MPPFYFSFKCVFYSKKKKFFLIFEFFIELKRYSKVQTLPNICFIYVLYYIIYVFILDYFLLNQMVTFESSNVTDGCLKIQKAVFARRSRLAIFFLLF
jgi:hypothetical protein